MDTQLDRKRKTLSQTKTAKKRRDAKRSGLQLSSLMNGISQAIKQPRWKLASAQTNVFAIEQLEPRLLLSADPLAALAANANDVTLQVVEKASNEQYIQLINNEDNGAVLGEQKLADIADSSVITIAGTNDDDKLTIDQSFLDLGERQFIVQFDGNQGEDTIATGATVTTSHWQVSGDNSGSMGSNGIVEYLNAEVLETVNSDDSQHVLSAINNSYSWNVTEEGNGVLSTLEEQLGSIIESESSTQMSFSGFDEISGSGTDYLDYSQYAEGVNVDLEQGLATGFDNVSGVNTLLGTSFDDTFTGDTNNNVFVVGFGDTVDGGDGFDSVVYRETGASGVDITVSVDTAEEDFTYQGGSWDGTDFTDTADQTITLVDVDLLSAEGGSGDNYFDFSTADVRVNLVGGDGADTLIGGSEDDVFVGGAGDDAIIGNGGDDEVISVRAEDFELTANKLKVGSDEEDTYTGIEDVYLKALSLDTDITGRTLDASAASDYNITLEGTELADTLIASNYGDQLSGFGGADTITAGTGTDTLVEDFSGRAHVAISGVDYELDLSQGDNEIVTITLPNATSGTGYTLSFTTVDGTVTTEEIVWDSATRDVSRAIEKALNLNYGQIIVTDVTDGWEIEFSGLYAGQPLFQSVAASSGSGVTIAISQTGTQVVDTLIGFSAADNLDLAGSVGADDVDLSAFTGNSDISTFGGVDTIRGAQGINTIDAGAGDDFIYVSGNANDVVIGGEGEDTLLADMSGDSGTDLTFNLDNDQLSIKAALISLTGIETAELIGSDGTDSFDSSDFHGVSESSSMGLIEGWEALSQHTLRFNLDDGATVIDVDVESASTLEDLLALINAADDRETGAMEATFDQATASVSISGIDAFGVAGDDSSILAILGLDGASVSSSVTTGVSMSLLASIHLTSQRGNAGTDTYVGSKGVDKFYIDDDDSSVTAGLGADTVMAETTATHTGVVVEDTEITWKGDAQTDKSVTLSGVEGAEISATTDATKLDASSASINVVLDAAQTTAELLGGTGYNELRIDVSQRSDSDTDVVSVTVDDSAVSNEVVFYGGSGTFDVSDFDWATISGSDFSFVAESSGHLTIDSDITVQGQSIKFRADNNRVTVNANINTDDLSGTAGNIEIYAKHIEVSDGVTISAKGMTLAQSGDLTFVASDARNAIKGIGFYNYDNVSASITIGAATTLTGRDITLLATAETNPDSPVNYGGEPIDTDVPSIQDFKDELENFSLFVGYSRSEVDTLITISESAVISGDNIVIESRSIARVTSEPLAFMLSVAIGSIKSAATVDMNGTILAEGDVTISSDTENYLKVTADQFFGFKGYSASVAVGLLDTDSNATVSETATIVSQGDLDVSAYTADFTYVGALSDAGAKGKLAASVAVHIENGDTNATLAGDVFVLGDVNVNADHKQGRVDGEWGTVAEAIVDRVPGVLDNIKDKYKQKGSTVLKSGGLAWLGKKSSPSDRLSPTKFTAGIAFAYSEDTNNANAYIGIDGETSDIQIGGSLNQSATVDSRMLTSVSSTSSSVSQTSQLQNSTGTKSEFSQVPFGGAVSVSIAELNNSANALMLGDTAIDVLDKMTLDAKSENLTGLISQDTTFKYVKPTSISNAQIDTDYAIDKDDLISFDYGDYDWQQIEAEQPSIGILGAVYKYLGDDTSSMRLASEDFSDTFRWELLGDKVTSLPNQLLGGESELYLIDNTVKSEAAGAKVSIGLNFGYLDSNQNAAATIGGAVEVNQREALENNHTAGDAQTLVDALLPLTSLSARNIDISSAATNKSVDYVGMLTDTSSNIPVLKQIYAAGGSSQSLNGSGASVYINNVTLNSQAIIENGAKVYADDLSIGSDATAFAINLGYSAGYGTGTLGMSGLFMGNYVESDSQARIDSGVDLEIATRINSAEGVERLSVTADNRVDIITVAGGGASGGAIGIGASSIVNEVTKVTKAQIGNSDAASRSGAIDVNGDVKVAATSEGFIFGTAMSASWATGKVAPSGGEAPKTANTEYGISVSGAFIFNTVDFTTSATIYNLNSLNADSLVLNASERSWVLAFPISYASAEANSFALAAAGIGLRNDVDFDIKAGIQGVNTLTADSLSIDSVNNSTVVTASISAALSSIAETSAGSSSSIALAGNVSINNVTNDLDAFLSNITTATINDKNGDGFAVDIEANDSSDIYAVALGVAYAGNGSVGVTYAENNIISDIDALISGVDLTVADGKVRQQANSEADILSVALGAAVSKDTSPDFDTKVGVSVAAAVSFNKVRMNTRAKVLNSTITLPSHDLDSARLDVIADNESDIIAVVVAPSVGLQSGGTTTVTLSGSGAYVENEVYGDTIATIDGSSIEQTATANVVSNASNGISVRAEADGDISATVVSASIAYAGATTGTGVSGGIGIAIAENNIGGDSGNANQISATIHNSDVDITGAVETSAESKQAITSNVIAASVALAKSASGAAGSLSGVGSTTDNEVKVDITSGVTATVANKSVQADSLAITAKDNSTITSTVVGASIAGSYSPSSGAGTLSIGVSLANNDVHNTTLATIDNVDIGTALRPIDSVSLLADSKATITATSVAASFAVSYSSSGSIAVSGAGANAINSIQGSTSASIIDSEITGASDITITATNTSTVNAQVAAVSVAAGGGNGGGLGVSIGAAVTENYIGDSGSALSVSASIQDSEIDTSGTITIDSTADLTIDSGVGAGSMAIAGGSGGGIAGSGSGVSAINEIYADANAYVDNTTYANQQLKAQSLTITAHNLSDITAIAAAASIAAGFGSGGGIAGTIGVALARNTIDTNSKAYVAGADLELGTGSLNLEANSDNDITSTSVAASVAVAFGSGGGIALSGAGANSINAIHGETQASMSGVKVLNAGGVTLAADNISDISATVAAVSVSGGGGSGGGVGVSIGAAVTENEIGTSGDRLKVAAYLEDTSVNASGALSLDANAVMTITSGVGAGGMAVAGGAGGGIAAAGSGVSATNDVYAQVESYIDNTGYSNRSITASSISLSSTSQSEIKAELGSASLGLAGGSGGGVSVTIGISLAENNIDVDTLSYIKGVNAIDSTGAIDISASTENDIDAISIAATSSIAGGAGGGISISGAGATADNSIAGSTMAFLENSQIDSASQVDINASDNSDIDATVVAASLSGAGGAGGGIGIAIGAALASNSIGTSGNRQSVRSYVKNSGITTSGDLSLTASGDMTIDAKVGAGSMAVSGGAGGGISGAGAGVSTTNDVYNEVVTYIDNSSASSKSINSSNLTLDSDNTSKITATAAAASLAAGFGAGGGISGSIGVALADNTVDADTYSYMTDVNQVTTGDVSISAESDNTIKATSVAASISAAGGAGGGIAISGAGAEATNDIFGTTSAYIANSTLGAENNNVGQVDVLASNTSSIESTIAAVSAAGAGGAGGGIGVSIGAAIANNEIGSSGDRLTVNSYIDNSELYASEALTVDSELDMTITAGVGAGSAAVAGGAVGISGSGAGVGVHNDIYADVDSYITDSTKISATDITITSLSESEIDATAGAASLSASFAPVGFTVSIAASEVSNTVDINLNSHVHNSTLVSDGTFTLTATERDDVYTTGVATSMALGIGFAGAGVFVDSKVTGNVGTSVTDSDITVYGEGSIKALADSKQRSESYGIAAGLVAAGVVFADSESEVNTTVTFNGVDYTGHDLTLVAKATENNYVYAVAGSGGVLAGAGVGADTKSTSSTLVSIGDETEITLGEIGGAGVLDVKAEHIAKFDAEIVAASGGYLSGSGAEVDHDITADVTVNLGDGSNDSDALVISAADINADAINRAWKNQDGQIRAAAVGLASAAGVDSRTVLDMETLIDVGDHASLTAWGTGDDDGISLNALNDLDITDKVILNAGGALAGTGATVKISDDQLLAKVRVGEDSTLVSEGDIQLSARGQGTVVSSVESDSIGAASVTVTESEANITPVNTILIDLNAEMTAYGNVNISAGTDTEFNRDDYKVHALIDNFAASLIPIDDSDALAKLTQTNVITIAAGAHVKTARQMNLHAERFGFADMDAQTKTVNWASALGGTADLGGDVVTGATGTVSNSGTLETGIRRNQSIEFTSLNDNGTVDQFTKTEGVTFSESIVALSSELFEGLEYAEEQLAIFNDGKASDTDIEKFYKSEVTRIQALLLEDGLLEEVKPGVFVPNQVQTSVITINDIYAEAGRIDIRSGDYEELGSVVSPGDASVDILNHTTASLVINAITIPQENGGIYLNGERQDADVDYEPLISVINDVDIDLAKAELALRFPDSNTVLTWPSISVVGDITNRTGTLELKSLSGDSETLGKGDINIYANIDVETQVVATGGSTVISLPPGSSYSVDGSEYAKWNSELGNNGLDEASQSDIDDLIDRSITGPSIYADSISITAEYININGKIQSGKENFTLDIDEALEDTIDGLRASGATGLIRLDTGSEDFSVFYDATNDQIVVGDMRVSGGYIELNGHILNTNSNSNIELLGGYAEITVNNHTDLDVKILGLDASQRGKGTLIIRDKAQADNSGNALVTTYNKDKDGVSVTTTYENSGSDSVSSGSDSMTYTPKSGWRYSWTMGQESFERLYTTEGTSSWLGIDAFASDPSDVTFSGTPEVVGTPTLRGEGAYFEYVPSESSDEYTFDTAHTTLSEEESLVRKWTKSTWWGKKTYYAKFVQESKVRDESTHSIKADYGVNITFTGKEAGAVDIVSNRGGDVIIQGSISNADGTTTITTNAGIYTKASGSVGGKNIVLTASKIGGAALTNADGSIESASSALKTNLTNDAGGAIEARTYGKRINIVEMDGPLVVKSITSASATDLSRDTGGKVYLSAVGGIEAQSGSDGVVRGGIININSEAHVGTSSNALNIDSGSTTKDSVSVVAVNDVYLAETDGDFLIKEITSSAGDVTLHVSHGSLIDANSTAARDERTYEALSNGLWENLGLISGSDSAQNKIDDVIDAFTSAREREYSEYWNIRNGQFDGDYDAQQVATISSGEESYYRTVYQQIGEEEGKSGSELQTFIDDAISTLNNKRNAEYHSLNSEYGSEVYDSEYSYELTAEKRAELTGSVHVWTEEQLNNLISGSLLKPITNTQASIEATNIDAAGDITIVSVDDIGSATGSVEIDLDGDYSDDERVQLAAAERNDVYFLLEERVQSVVVDVNESASGDALVRNSGSWLADGFVAGMQIRIAGDSANANDEGSFYDIQSVTADTLTLTSTALSVEVAVTLDVAAISSSPNLTTIVNTNGDNWADLGLTLNDVVEVDGSVYQIQRIAFGVLDLEGAEGAVTEVLSSSDYRQATVTKVLIDQREDIDVLVAGELDATATNNVYLGSEQSIVIDSVSGDNVRIKSKQSLLDGSGSAASVTASSTMVLEAGSGSIGSDANRFAIDLESGATLTARAKQDIVITEIDSDINVSTIYSSNGKVDLLALNGSIVDAFDHEYENIRAQDIVLTADKGAIGSLANLLDINLIGGVVTANALDDISLNETELNMAVDHIESEQGDVKLVAHMAIVDGVVDEASEIADIVAASIELTARFDTVGELGNDVEIDTGSQSGDNLTVTSAENTHITEMRGDLYLNQISTGAAAIAFIAAPAGRILNDNQSGANVVSGMTYLFAAQDIGTSDNELTTEVGNIQGQSTTGSTYVSNTGALNIGGVVSGLPNGLLAGGSVNIVTKSPMTIIENITAEGDINLTSADNSANDDIVIASGIKLSSEANININSGDGFTLSSTAVLQADNSINIQIDEGKIGNSDSMGAKVDIQGTIDAGNQLEILGNDNQDEINIEGIVSAVNINIDTGEDDDVITVSAQSILGDVHIAGGAGNDTITINQLHTRTDSFTLDGEGGSDQYIINRTGSDADYIIDVVDSGAANNGADTLTLNGLASDDTFLIRANFVAAMHEDGNGAYGNTVERINYDGNINARLTINGLEGEDNFFSDDTGTIVTLDGGADNDTFQVGQLFGSDRQAGLGTVAAGDEIETTETTLGFLSKGNSLPMVIYGGDGSDSIKVYSNKAVTKLYGEDGDDSFVVRAFLLKDSGLTNNSVDVELFGGEGADTIEYSINAALKIDGGAGNDKVVVLGTEGDDSFMITEDGIFGAGLNIGYTGVEFAEVDGLEGDDTFYVLSTNAEVETTIIGGLGADVFNVASDVTQPIVSYSVEGRSSFINHSVFSDDDAYNGIFVDGISLNVASKDNGAIAISDQNLLVDEEGMIDSYELSLSVDEPSAATIAYVTVSAARASSSDKESTNGNAASILVSLDNVNFYESLVVTYESGVNWAETNTLYVKAIDDTAMEGARDYVINHSVQSDNPEFDNLDIANVAVSVYDNDQADIIVIPQAGNRVTEGGASEAFDVYLSTQPEVGETVTVSLAELLSDKGSQLTLSDETFTFDHTNWDDVQTFTVTATDDTDVENLYQGGVTLTASSDLDGSDYNNVSEVDQVVFVTDNDSGSVIVTTSNGSTLVSETQTDDYTLVLSKAPTDPVTINLLNDGQTLFDSGDARFNADDNTVTFTAADWDQPITITLEVNPDYQVQEGQPVQNPPLQPHTLTSIKGKLIVEGGVPEGKARALSVAVMLPTETDSELPIKNIEINENQQTDVLNIFNDGSLEKDTGILSGTSLTGLGMGAGIEYGDIEVVELLLGQKDDNVTVTDTAENSITVVHGGGGSDTLTVTGSDANSALILFGDTAQNGWTYNATSDEKTDKAREFSNPGNDTMDASGANGSVTLYGGEGNDTITGSHFGDHIAGGSGNDTLFGLDGEDHIYGDAGFNVDISTRLDLSTQILTVVNIADAGIDNLDTSDSLALGNDVIDAGLGDDIVIADKGWIHQADGVNRILSTTRTDITDVTNAGFVAGGLDTVFGNAGNDIIFGGQGSDTLSGGNGPEGASIATQDNDVLIGDMGTVKLVSAEISQVFTTDSNQGAADNIYGDEGHDIILAGAGSDYVESGQGNDTVLGDFGDVDLRNGVVLLKTEDGDQPDYGDDEIHLGSGNDRVLAGLGGDTVTSESGNTDVIADNGYLNYNAQGHLIDANTSDASLGGDDNITLGLGDNTLLGGNGSDTMTTAGGNDHIIGDNGQFLYDELGILTQAKTSDLAQGADDVIDAGDGVNLVLGGQGNDSITTGDGNDVVIGDNGQINLVDGIRREVFSTDTTNTTGGNDVISLGAGEDQAIAGVGSDQVTNLSGETIIIGDDGLINSDATGRYVLAKTGNTTIGGNDTVLGGTNRDILFGGFGADRLDGQAGDDILGGDGSQITRNNNTIVFEAIDLFVGGNDTLLAGAGLDRMQGHFGSDLFFASFSEDVLLGEYGRFTFVESGTEGDSDTTFIISLAQGQLDLIRRMQTGLFGGYAKQVYAQSNLGEASRSRTAVTTVFSLDAEQAFANLNPTFQSIGSGGAEGADFVIPTAPTAAGTETDPEEVKEEQTSENSEPKAVKDSVEATEQTAPEPQSEVPELEAEKCAEEDVECKLDSPEPNNKQQVEPSATESTVDNSESEVINIEAAIAGLGGWMVMKADKGTQAGSNRQEKKRKQA